MLLVLVFISDFSVFSLLLNDFLDSFLILSEISVNHIHDGFLVLFEFNVFQGQLVVLSSEFF
jgi:hypothetical protein